MLTSLLGFGYSLSKFECTGTARPIGLRSNAKGNSEIIEDK